MRPLPRPQPRRLPILRRPRPFTIWVVATAALTFWFVTDLTGDATAARDRWGDTTEVAVASVGLSPGDVVRAGDSVITAVPIGLVPDGAVTTDPTGRTARERIGAGELLVEHRFAGPHVDGLPALLEPGQRGVAVPTTGLDIPVGPGDRVDVLATLDSLAEPGADPTLLLAERARVIAVDDEAVTIAVGAYDAVTITHALVNSTVTLTLTT